MYLKLLRSQYSFICLYSLIITTGIGGNVMVLLTVLRSV